MINESNNIYNNMFPLWQKCRDVINGQSAIKKGGELYLPRPNGMDEKEYKNSYLRRAKFPSFTARTHNALNGLAMAKPVMKNIDEKLYQYLENVNGEGKNLDKFIEDIFSDTLITSYSGVLVDAPSTTDVSITEAEKMGLFPYMAYYPAESIINVQTNVVNRNKTVSLVVLQENVNVPIVGDPYKVNNKKIYRALILEDGIYKQRIYDEHAILISEVIPMKKGKPFTYIPFFFTTDILPSTPLLENLADVNISWYMKSADLENGLHWTSVPTPYSIGHRMNENDSPIQLGGAKFIFFPEDVTQVGYLEFSGNGLKAISEEMNSDRETMAILGARIIATEKKGVESARTADIHRIGENSVLASYCNKVSDCMTRATKEYLEWIINADITSDFDIHINTDYNLEQMDSSTLTALVSAWQTGGISKRTLFNNLKEGEIINADKTFEEEQQEIEEDGISLGE